MKNVSILIVEDEAIIAENLARSIMGYRVAGITATGEEAIQLAGQTRPALLARDHWNSPHGTWSGRCQKGFPFLANPPDTIKSRRMYMWYFNSFILL